MGHRAPVVQNTGIGRDVGRLLTDATRVLTGKLTVACAVLTDSDSSCGLASGGQRTHARGWVDRLHAVDVSSS